MNKSLVPLRSARLGMPHAGLAALILLVFMATWACNLRQPHSPEFRAGSQLLAIMLGIYACAAPMIGAGKLGQAALLFLEMKTPTLLWQAWLRAFLRSQALVWAIVSLAGSTLLAVSDTLASASATLMLYSLIMAGATALPLAQRNLLPRYWPSLIALIPAAYLGFTGLKAYADLVALPLFVKLALALAWPLLTAYIGYRWKTSPPQQLAAFPIRRRKFCGTVRDWYRRYTVLSPTPHAKKQRYGSIWILPYILVMENSGFVPNHTWNGSVGPQHLLTLLFILTFAGYFLYCRDLHWRYVLAPGGIARGRMGWHVVRSTLTVFASTLIPALFACATLVWLISGISLFATLGGMLRFFSLACELVFIVCVATALRGAKYWWLATIALYGVIALAVLAATLTLHLDARTLMGTWFHVGPAYLAMLTAGSLAAILVANRLWTTQRLLPLVVQGMVEEDMPNERWLRRVGLSSRI